MAVARVDVGAERVEVERQLARRVGAVDDREHSGRAGRGADLRDREHERGRRGDVADRDRLRPRPDRRRELVRLGVDELRADELPGSRHGAVLVPRRQHLVAGLEAERADDRIQAGGRVGDEDEIVGARAEKGGQRGARPGSQLVETAGEERDGVALELALQLLIAGEDGRRTGAVAAVVQEGDLRVEQEIQARYCLTVRELPPQPEPTPAALGAAPAAGRPDERVRQRARRPVPAHLPAQRARDRPRRRRPDPGDERRRQPDLGADRRDPRRPPRGQDDADRGARLPRDRVSSPTRSSRARGRASSRAPSPASATALFWPAQSTLLAGLSTRAQRPATFAMQRVVMNLGIGLGGVAGGFIAVGELPGPLRPRRAHVRRLCRRADGLRPRAARASGAAPSASGSYRTVFRHKVFMGADGRRTRSSSPPASRSSRSCPRSPRTRQASASAGSGGSSSSTRS